MLRLGLALLLCATAVHGFWTCSRGAYNHDWVAFDSYPTPEDANFIDTISHHVVKLIHDKNPGEKLALDEAERKHCVREVNGLTIGWHNARGEDLKHNTVNDDDIEMFEFGCPDPEHFPISDRYGRLAALMSCLIYSKKAWRPYEMNLAVAAGRGTFRVFCHSSRNYDCDDVDRPLWGDILKTKHKEANYTRVCWEYVTDVRDLACKMVHANKGSKKFATDSDIQRLLAQVKDTKLKTALTVKSDASKPDYLVDFNGDDKRTCSAEMGGSTFLYAYAPSRDQAIAELIHNELPEADSAEQLTNGEEVSAAKPLEFSHDEELKLRRKTSVKGAGKHVKIGDFTAPEHDMARKYLTRPNEPKLKVSEIQAKHVPFIAIDDHLAGPGPSVTVDAFTDHTEDYFEAPHVVEPEERSGASSDSSWQSSMVVLAPSVASSYKSSGYSQEVLRGSAQWLHNRVSSLASSSRFLAASIGAMQLIAAETLIALARANGMCEYTMSNGDCMCLVVAPMLDAISDIFARPPPLEGTTKAVTIIATKMKSTNIFAKVNEASAGIYFTLYWQINGRTNIGLEFGLASGSSTSVSLGTDMVDISASVALKLAVFFGLKSEISPYSKGINFGLDLGIKGKVGLSFLFRSQYVSIANDVRCAPISYGDDSTLGQVASAAGRFLLLPVNPVCVQGFAITVFLGTGVGKTFDLNVYTGFETMKYTALLQVNKDNEGVVRGQVHFDPEELVEHAKHAIPVLKAQPAGLLTDEEKEAILKAEGKSLLHKLADKYANGRGALMEHVERVEREHGDILDEVIEARNRHLEQDIESLQRDLGLLH